MITLVDVRWSDLTGGYRTPLDPRLLRARLETDSDTTGVWQVLWDELHHQGDVGEASFAAVPFLVRNYLKRGVPDWNTYAIVAIIELARREDKNPDVPRWIADDYFHAIGELAKIGTTEVLQAKTPENVRAILGVIAIEKGLRTHGRFLVDYSEDDLLDLESRVSLRAQMLPQLVYPLGDRNEFL
ncbi:MAG: hypothetical protein WBX22_01245 [Silvibacterium sp.]